MALPLIAIVGRPNVGKSMLFNKIIGRRLSIVEDTPGVTRDRIYGESEWVGRKFRLVDTGGIEPNTDSQILSFMREQAQIAIDNADVIIFVTDIKTGLTASDQEVASMLQRSRKPIVLAVNKMDSVGAVDPDFYEFYNLGLADAQTRVQPPTDKGRRLKIYYMTQVGVKPPHFVIFCNDKKLFHFSYQRYLENQLRSVFGLEGTPIVLTIRQKGEDDG